jgi:hypothetical protein
MAFGAAKVMGASTVSTAWMLGVPDWVMIAFLAIPVVGCCALCGYLQPLSEMPLKSGFIWSPLTWYAVVGIAIVQVHWLHWLAAVAVAWFACGLGMWFKKKRVQHESLSREWFYLDHDRSVGPVSEEGMVDLISANSINASTLVRHDESSGWIPLGQAYVEPPLVGRLARMHRIAFVILLFLLLIWPMAVLPGLLQFLQRPLCPKDIGSILLVAYPIILFTSWRLLRRSVDVQKWRSAVLWVFPPLLSIAVGIVGFDFRQHTGEETYKISAPSPIHGAINQLIDRMYCIGETSGKLEEFVRTEGQLAEWLRSYVSECTNRGDLVATDANGQTPLMVAVFMGYSRVVEELLRAEEVRQGINNRDSRGVSAWMYATFAFRQTMWVFDPAVVRNQWRFVPLAVTQPYYLQSKENPYKRIRMLLEGAGAMPDQRSAKRFWLCKSKRVGGVLRQKIESAGDLQDVLLAEGVNQLNSILNARSN